MQFNGRLTADAKVNTTPNNRQVVNFDIAINDRYKNKSGDWVTTTTYIRCAYWRSTAVSKILKKGNRRAYRG